MSAALFYIAAALVLLIAGGLLVDNFIIAGRW